MLKAFLKLRSEILIAEIDDRNLVVEQGVVPGVGLVRRCTGNEGRELTEHTDCPSYGDKAANRKTSAKSCAQHGHGPRHSGRSFTMGFLTMED
jgi:hypothetical protein